jgi:thioester reductase-like protein
METMEDQELTEAVAVIGMAGRFPGAGNLDEFWRNLRDGVDAIHNLTDEELREAGIDPAIFTSPSYVKAAAPIGGVEMFDAGFFGFSPREAEILDPQHRVFLECAWEALEGAGYVSESYDGWVGLFAGVSLPTYMWTNLVTNPELMGQMGFFQVLLSNDRDYFPTRVSYKLNLKGPSVNVQTACSTSLVATHLACQSLLSYQCSVAIAGGVRVNFPQMAGYLHQEGGIFSPDGRCRAFDANGKGALFGEGVGVVVLKRLSEAIAHGDTIRAVIKGSAYNNDGSNKVGYTAPSVDGQAEAIALAQAVAGVHPDTLSYIETHGSGTPLGDPIEVTALSRVFRAETDRRGFCALGSVKASVGHLEAAAGVAGLIKTVLALEHRTLPPSLHFETPNPRIDFEASPFYVNTEARPWEADGTPRRAGVSSFGMGGTNAHLILEEAPPLEPSTPSRPWQLLLLSAKTATALETSAANLVRWLREHPEADFADVAHTLRVGRRTFPHRLALVCRDRDDALAALESRDPRRLLGSVQDNADRPVTFLFPGLGEHYAGMAADLYRTEPTFREELDRCCDLLTPELGTDPRTALLAETGGDAKALFGRGGDPATTGPLTRTALAQPAVFAVEYALAKLLMEWGIHPQSMIGYSLGEYVAACLAGVLSLEHAARLVARRAKLIDGLPAGAMLAVPLPEAEVQEFLEDGLSLAALNGPAVSVLAGPEEAVLALESRLAERGIAARRLPTTHAFHSRMMEPIREEFAKIVRGMPLAPPEIPYLSNVTGTWITTEEGTEATDPGYWVRHMLQTVRYADGLAELRKEPDRVLVEVGPGQGLTAIAVQGGAPELISVPTLRPAWESQPAGAYLLTALAKLWLAGLRIDWTGFTAHERRRRVLLPTYPFERRRFFIDRPRRGQALQPDVPLTAISPTASGEPEAKEKAAASSTLTRHARPANLRNPYVPPATDPERRLAEVWQDVLGIEQVGVHDSFFDLGGHSLLAPQLLIKVRAAFGVDFPMRHLFETPTVAAMVPALELLRDAGIAALAATREQVDLRAEGMNLDPTIQPEGPRVGDISNPSEVFLTGATGFFGTFLLDELLRQTSARVHCLVRAADEDEAFRRLRDALVAREVWHDGLDGRLVAIPGDLGEPRFGLSEAAFRELAGRVDAVYHNGAWVNFTYPYKVLKPSNVIGTVEALRLASQVRTKPVHFISSITAVPEVEYGYREDPTVYEDDDTGSLSGLFGGYGETKWVSEQLCKLARSRGIPVSIYRPTVLSGHSHTGVSNTRDLVWNMIKGCVQLGSTPDGEQYIEIAPVDYVASAAIRISLGEENLNRVYHFPHPDRPRWRPIFEFMREYGYPLTWMPSGEWELHAIERLQTETDNALAPFMPVVENFEAYAETARREGRQGKRRQIFFDDRNTQHGIQGSGITCPPIYANLLTVYFDYFVRSGFLPPPPGRGARTEPVREPAVAG